MSLHSESSYVAQAWRQIVERPLRDILVFLSGIQEGCWPLRRHRDVKLTQWKRQTQTSCLEIGFLPGPAVKKSCCSHVWRNCAKHPHLRGGEEVLSDWLPCYI